ncbi:MAG: hypothetical protein L6Q98_06230 [Anaerolineae bacterium]|nr:hypothetical protein [Anaerolineae bacterium]NUQ02781.1 hypothetical protein [Anaerolineae bacterium]
MRRLLVICGMLMLSFASGFGSAGAQAFRYAAPPITRIDLNTFEPLPPGVPTDVFFGGLGGGEGEMLLVPPGLYWETAPDALVAGDGAYFAACGYSSDAPPSAFLALPSSGQITVIVNHYFNTSNCFDFYLEWSYGMELGIYTLTLNHPDGVLSYTFGVDYPFCWQYTRTQDDLEWVMGLEPNEQITFYFYAFTDPSSSATQFVAQRSLSADSEGVIALDIRVGRTAPFAREDLVFATAGVGRNYYDILPAVDSQTFADMGFVFQPYIPPEPAHPHLGIGAGFYVSQDARGVSCDGDFSTFAQTQPNSSIPLYDQINSANSVGSLAGGMVIEVLESHPVYSGARVYVWKRIRAEDGQVGWTPSNEFVEVYPRSEPGVRARLEPGAVFDSASGVYRPGPQPIFDSPQGQIIRQQSAGSEVVLLEAATLDVGEWWRVRLDDGAEGWLPSFDSALFSPTFEALPWAPVGSGGAPGGGAGGQPAALCPGSPPPRLSPGRIGRVLPGDPNRLRAAPESGRVIDNIPGGAAFTVLGGPQCGAQSGLTWWQVEYNGQVGWTAEGQANIYWLEPVG